MSDEIPVGSPPAPPGRHAAPGGWYADPTDPARERYWDGWQWSRQTRPAQHAKRPRSRTAPAPATASTSATARGSATAQRQPGESPLDDRLAGWWHRAGAAALDGLILFVVVTAILSPLYLQIGERLMPEFREMFAQALNGIQPSQLRPEELMSQRESMTILVVSVVIGLTYHAGFLKWRGATLGKLITGLRVVSAGAPDGAPASNAPEAVPGGPLTWRQALSRAMIWVFPGQSTCLWPIQVVDIILPLTDPQKRALHDRMAGTRVIRR